MAVLGVQVSSLNFAFMGPSSPHATQILCSIYNTVISKYTVFLKYIATAFLKIFPKYFPACSGKGNIDRGMIAI